MSKARKAAGAEGQAAPAGAEEGGVVWGPKLGTGAEEKISKMEAVRRALAAEPGLAGEAGVLYMRQHFGIEMSVGNFSAYKSQIKAQQAGTTGGGERGQGKGKAMGGAKVDYCGPVAEVKALLDEHGAEKVSALLEPLSALIGKYGSDQVAGLVNLLSGTK